MGYQPKNRRFFCLSTEVPRDSAGSVGTYNRHTLIVFITNNTALRMFEHIQNSIANREFLASIQAQGWGDTGLYTLQGVSVDYNSSPMI